MTRPVWSTIGAGCLMLAVLSVPACDRTPSGPTNNDRPSIGGVAATFNTVTLPTPTGPVTLTEGGDVCIRATAFTIILVKNTRLMCDTECATATVPCFQFGAPGIKLDLNGRRVSGPAERMGCLTPTEFLPGDGIASVGHGDIVIEGPGLVERFRRHGIALTGIPNPPPSPPTPLRRATVKRVTSHHNCFSGIWLAMNVRESLVEDVVSVRNAGASDILPCGGLCITNSHDNRIRRSEFAGNGSVVPGGIVAPGVLVPNDFGVGLVGNSSGNIIEENGIGGNINGVLVSFSAVRNLIRKNVIAGNPPITLPSGTGFDIRNFSPAGINRFEDNLCITSTGDPPCPNLPQWAGHQNNG
jgi:hypothetical protein